MANSIFFFYFYYSLLTLIIWQPYLVFCTDVFFLSWNPYEMRCQHHINIITSHKGCYFYILFRRLGISNKTEKSLYVFRVLKYPKKCLKHLTTFFMSSWWVDCKKCKKKQCYEFKTVCKCFFQKTTHKIKNA